MTPVEIFEYKQKWMGSGDNNPISIHSDKRRKALEWCRKNLYRHQWNIVQYTDVYEDTFFFEHKLASENFEKNLK